MFYNANAPFCFVDINYTTMANNPMGTGYKQIVLQADSVVQSQHVLSKGKMWLTKMASHADIYCMASNSALNYESSVLHISHHF